MRRFWIKLRSWEYWPVWIIYFVVFFAWIWYSLRLRSFLFFTTVNPTIEMGGMMGESKIGILQQVPAAYKPRELFVSQDEDIETMVVNLQRINIRFPCVAKPDVGERGFLVKICNDKQQLRHYHRQINQSYIIQEFVDFEMEYAVLYYRYPDQQSGRITSLCKKEYLQVVGNGVDTMAQLLQQDDRAFLQYDRLLKEGALDFDAVLRDGQLRIIEKIGNHSKGTMFLNANEDINEALIATFDKIFLQMPEIHFGRVDLKCTSLDDLRSGRNIRIMEINGVSAEPAHIYDPDYTFFKATRDLLKQWKILYKISKIQIQRGVKPMSFFGILGYIKKYKDKLNLHHNN